MKGEYEMLEIREKIIDYVRSAGQTIVDNAEDIVGNGENLCGLSVWVFINPDEVPTIEVSKEYPVEMKKTWYKASND